MKVLIWFLCIFANAIITAVIKENGIILGGIPAAFLTFATFSLAFFLCRKWDDHKQAKKTQNDKLPTINQVNNFTVYTYDTVTQKARKDERAIDTNKFPPEKYAVDGIYYAIEKVNTGKKVRAYCSKSIWQNHVDNKIAKKGEIKFCRKCGFKLVDDSDFCSNCGTNVIK